MFQLTRVVSKGVCFCFGSLLILLFIMFVHLLRLVLHFILFYFNRATTIRLDSKKPARELVSCYEANAERFVSSIVIFVPILLVLWCSHFLETPYIGDTYITRGQHKLSICIINPTPHITLHCHNGSNEIWTNINKLLAASQVTFSKWRIYALGIIKTLTTIQIPVYFCLVLLNKNQ